MKSRVPQAKVKLKATRQEVNSGQTMTRNKFVPFLETRKDVGNAAIGRYVRTRPQFFPRQC